MDKSIGNTFLRELRRTGKLIVYRGYRREDKTPIIAKVLAVEQPSPQELAKFRYEYQLFKELNLRHAPKALALESYQNSLALVLEDTGGESLRHVLSTQYLDSQSQVRIAIQLSTLLAELHQQGFLHGDVRPVHFLVHLPSFQVQWLDLSSATRLSPEGQARLSSISQECVDYLSPEQVARMNRPIDCRSDLYALGVILYEMLAGHFPFQGEDLLEMMHARLTQVPIAPHQYNPAIPPALSAVVMKLLAKMPEERYHTALGLKADLEFILSNLTNLTDLADFKLAQQDIYSHVNIPKKNYGRAVEYATLIEALTKAQRGIANVVLIGGATGSGKGSLVNEMHAYVIQQGGYFLSGKCDRFQYSLSRNALIIAFRKFMRHCLAESDSRLAVWRDKLKSALGNNAQLLINLIPELEHIIGKQPSVVELSPCESHNRLVSLFQNFLEVFARPAHPLVIFLEDLQYTTLNTFYLLENLLSDYQRRHLLIIGAYCTDKIEMVYPIEILLSQLWDKHVLTTHLILSELPIEAITDLLSDMLHCTKSIAQPLAEVVAAKTGGNLLSIHQFLQKLLRSHLLSCDSQGQWHWQLEPIEHHPILQTVATVLNQQIAQLPPNPLHLLELAACIGEQFDVHLLQTLCREPLALIVNHLAYLVEIGYLMPADQDCDVLPHLAKFVDETALKTLKLCYRFTHARLHSATYDLLSESRKQTLHYQIGLTLWQPAEDTYQKLLTQKPLTVDEQNRLFDIVQQLNLGRNLLRDEHRRQQLAELNWHCAQTAKQGSAFELANEYLKTALQLLGENGWHTVPALSFAIHLSGLELACLSAHYTQAHHLAAQMLQYTIDLLQRAQIHELQVRAYLLQEKPENALETGLNALEELGISFSLEAVPILPPIPALHTLTDLPPLNDKKQLAVLKLLIPLTTLSYQAHPELALQLITKMLTLCHTNRHPCFTAYAYALYGTALCNLVQDIPTGYEAGQLALQLADYFSAKPFKCKILTLVNGFIRPWRESLQPTLPSLLEAKQIGLDTGDLEYANLALFIHSVTSFFTGEPLTTLKKRLQDHQNTHHQYKSTVALQSEQLLIHTIDALTARNLQTSDSTTDTDHPTLQHISHLMHLMTCYLRRENTQAVHLAQRAVSTLTPEGGALLTVNHNFYHTLALIAAYPQEGKATQALYLQQIDTNQQQLHKWVTQAPQNWQHKYILIAAEKARITDQRLLSIDYYDDAIRYAHEQAYLPDEALANELAAQFYLEWGKPKNAQPYLKRAYFCYQQWGATYKAAQLEHQYAEVHLVIRREEEVN